MKHNRSGLYCVCIKGQSIARHTVVQCVYVCDAHRNMCVCVCTHRGASKCDGWGLPGDTETAAGGGEASGAGGGDGDRGCGLWSDSHTDILSSLRARDHDWAVCM